MKKLLTVLATSAMIALMSLPTSAGEFYKASVGFWDIFGLQTPELNACFLDQNFEDGSSFSLATNLDDGELLIMFNNTQWNLKDRSSENIQFIFEKSNGETDGDYVTWEYWGPQDAAVLNLDPAILDAIADYKTLNVLMPDEKDSIAVDLTDSRKALEKFMECVEKGVSL